MSPDKQIQFIKIANDFNSVTIKFLSAEFTEKNEGSEDNGESSIKAHQYAVVGKNRPHTDFIDSLKKLRKFALEALEINLANSADLAHFTVNSVKISGDMIMNQSRVIMTLAKKVDWSGKIAEIKTPQITMYPQQDETKRFFNAEKMTEQIELVVEEAWNYLDGKCEGETQLPLFPSEEALELNFTK